MKKLILLQTTLIISTCLLIGQDFMDSVMTRTGFPVTIESKPLNDNVKLYISLQGCFKQENEYPLIILLDGHSTFRPFSSLTELMAYNKSIPCAIVVGFPQYAYDPSSKEDFTVKMEKLIKFFDTEMMPYLNSKYNISKTIIWGQGLSGVMTTYIMLEKPTLFNGYISDMPDFNYFPYQIESKDLFNNLINTNVNYYIFGSSHLNIYNETYLNNLKVNSPRELKWSYFIEEEPDWIIYASTNYMHAIKLFLNDSKE